MEKMKYQDNIVFGFILLFSISILFFRSDGVYFLGQYLWAEDGSVFLNQMNEWGGASIWKPYAGYLHLYPRLILLFSSGFDLVYKPVVLLMGWFLSYIFMTAVFVRQGINLGLKLPAILMLTTLIAFQPNYGEVFFNITNSQWMLGLGFSILVLSVVGEYKFSIVKFVCIVLLGLTGPFSIILTPLLVLKALIIKDLKSNLWVYLTILGCALIQLTILVNSDRGVSESISLDPWAWYISFSKIVLFGVNDIAKMISALIFWMVIIYFIINKSETENNRIILLTLLAAILFIIAAMFSSKSDPMAIAFLGSGNRYSFIPYGLIFFCAMLLSNYNKLLQYLLFSLILFICYGNFNKVNSPNLQFKSFANFANYKAVIIPLHPQWAAFPSWHINANEGNKLILNNVKDLSLSLFSVSGAESDLSEKGLSMKSSSNDPQLIYNRLITCEDTTDVAIEIVIERDIEGWMQVFWGNGQEFSENKSLSRWYPSGMILAQFAFPYSDKGVYFRLDPFAVSNSTALIKKSTIYCLP